MRMEDVRKKRNTTLANGQTFCPYIIYFHFVVTSKSCSWQSDEKLFVQNVDGKDPLDPFVTACKVA